MYIKAHMHGLTIKNVIFLVKIDENIAIFYIGKKDAKIEHK
jgi:hypothetical protein